MSGLGYTFAPSGTLDSLPLPTALPQAAPAAATTDPSQVDYSQLLPTESDLASYAPFLYQQFGSIPAIQAATVNASSADNSQLPGALSAYQALNAASLAPTFRQQQDNLDSTLASRGIFNSTAGQQLQNDLTGQQDAALASADSPLVSQFAQDFASNQQLNAQLGQQAALANQSSYNDANKYNADAYGAVTGSNLQNYNNYLGTLGNLDTTQRNGLFTNTLGSYDPNANGQNSNTSAGGAAAGQAYSTAFANGAANTANLSSTLGSLGQSLAQHATGTNNTVGGFVDDETPGVTYANDTGYNG